MFIFFCNFAHEMEKILKVHRVNDYARYIGVPILHPLVSIIHYDELEHCRHSLNNYDVYGIFIGDETLENLTYGLIQKAFWPVTQPICETQTIAQEEHF